jgi:hypothetical protein
MADWPFSYQSSPVSTIIPYFPEKVKGLLRISFLYAWWELDVEVFDGEFAGEEKDFLSVLSHK